MAEKTKPTKTSKTSKRRAVELDAPAQIIGTFPSPEAMEKFINLAVEKGVQVMTPDGQELRIKFN